jgi:hypothetical protein
MTMKDSSREAVLLSLRQLERAPGDMLRDPKLVYDTARRKRDEAEAANKAALAASKQARTDRRRAKTAGMLEGMGLKVSS